jgi:hypothetical protein
MKKILALGSLLLAFNSYSQSYLILNNGVTLTTDKAAFVYDFANFILPYKVTLTGGQFFAEEGKLVSTDDKGFLYRKDEKAPEKIKGKGNNYLLSDKGTLYTFDANGFFYKFDKEAATKKTVGYGGNFFTVKLDDKKPIVDLYTTTAKGNYFKIDVVGLNPADITVFGGRYFQTNKGVTYTVTKDGFVFPKAEVKTAAIKKMGGNYFIDTNNALYTISEEGFLFLPTLPMTLKVASISKLGTNYFIDQDGKLFGVDSTGAVVERTITAHDIKEAKILSM